MARQVRLVSPVPGLLPRLPARCQCGERRFPNRFARRSRPAGSPATRRARPGIRTSPAPRHPAAGADPRIPDR
jgi:hypothetical protein